MDESLEDMPQFDKPENIPLVIPDDVHPDHFCKHVKPDGSKCRFMRNRAKGRDFCWHHDPAVTQEERHACRARGGSTDKIVTFKRSYRPKTREEILLLLSIRMDQFQGKFRDVSSPEVELTICQMARTYISVLEAKADEDVKVSGWRMKKAK